MQYRPKTCSNLPDGKAAKGQGGKEARRRPGEMQMHLGRTTINGSLSLELEARDRVMSNNWN